jgi:hypothetical protein
MKNSSHYFRSNVCGLFVLAVRNTIHEDDARAARAQQTDQKAKETVEVPSRVVLVGDHGVVDSGAKATFLGTTKDNYDEVMKAAMAHDKQGMLESLIAGKAFIVDQGTRVLVIDSSFTLKRVRLLSGTKSGKAG